MARTELPWTPDAVADRFSEAAVTARRLPPVRVQGYFNCWPAFARNAWEAFSIDEPVHRSFPPSPEDVDRMLEVMRWVQWLEVEQRHLLWMRAKNYDWKSICRRLACDRSTAWRRWRRALQTIADHLNEVVVPVV